METDSQSSCYLRSSKSYTLVLLREEGGHEYEGHRSNTKTIDTANQDQAGEGEEGEGGKENTETHGEGGGGNDEDEKDKMWTAIKTGQDEGRHHVAKSYHNLVKRNGGTIL